MADNQELSESVESKVASFEPAGLDARLWSRFEAEVRNLVRRTRPRNREDAKNLMSALVALISYFACDSTETVASLLTTDKIAAFERLHVSAGHKMTTAQVASRRLVRLAGPATVLGTERGRATQRNRLGGYELAELGALVDHLVDRGLLAHAQMVVLAAWHGVAQTEAYQMSVVPEFAGTSPWPSLLVPGSELRLDSSVWRSTLRYSRLNGLALSYPRLLLTWRMREQRSNESAAAFMRRLRLTQELVEAISHATGPVCPQASADELSALLGTSTGPTASEGVLRSSTHSGTELR